MSVEFSLRYFVIGVYLDRGGRVVRVYPLPFVRVTLGDDNVDV